MSRVLRASPSPAAVLTPQPAPAVLSITAAV
jgi:hypothetical protein